MIIQDNIYSRIHIEVSYNSLVVLIKLLPKRGMADDFDVVALAVNPITTAILPAITDWGTKNVL